MKHCIDAPTDVGCCVSCHEDDENGWAWMLYIDFDSEEYYVCCAVANALERME